MVDEYTPFGPKVQPRTHEAGEVVFIAQKVNETYRAEIRDNGEAGWEFQIYVNDQFSYGKRHEARFLAEAGARIFLETYRDLGSGVTA
jgi:hypothetical protein